MTAAKKTHRITLIPGDGIGPEVSSAVVNILEAAGAATGVAFEWHRYDAGADAFAKTESTSRRCCMTRLNRTESR